MPNYKEEYQDAMRFYEMFLMIANGYKDRAERIKQTKEINNGNSTLDSK